MLLTNGKKDIIMIITLKKNAPKHDVDKLIDKFEGMNLHVTMIQGDNYNVFGLVGDTSVVDEKSVMANPIVYNVQRVAQPYKLTNRMFHPEDTIVDVNGIQIGGKKNSDDCRSMFCLRVKSKSAVLPKK